MANPGWIDGQRTRAARQRAIKGGYISPAKRDRCGSCVYSRAVYNKTHLTITCKQHDIVIQKQGWCPTFIQSSLVGKALPLEEEYIEADLSSSLPNQEDHQEPASTLGEQGEFPF
jgi:hypothetical protein